MWCDHWLLALHEARRSLDSKLACFRQHRTYARTLLCQHFALNDVSGVVAMCTSRLVDSSCIADWTLCCKVSMVKSHTGTQLHITHYMVSILFQRHHHLFKPVFHQHTYCKVKYVYHRSWFYQGERDFLRKHDDFLCVEEFSIFNQNSCLISKYPGINRLNLCSGWWWTLLVMETVFYLFLRIVCF